MVKVKEDMAGWVMAEHGVPDSLLTVIEQTDDYISPTGIHYSRWKCMCSCEKHNILYASGTNIRSGEVKSCGCLKKAVVIRMGEINKKFNKYDLTGEYGVGWTMNSNKEFYFDLEDYDLIKDYCWSENHPNGGYSMLMTYDSHIKKYVSFHRLLKPEWNIIDHIDRNTLNNRKNNLRQVTHAENMRNTTLRKTSKTGFIGVHERKSAKKNKWLAYIGINKEIKYLGVFQNKDDAIKARLRAEIEYFGIEFAPQRHLFEQYGII